MDSFPSGGDVGVHQQPVAGYAVSKTCHPRESSQGPEECLPEGEWDLERGTLVCTSILTYEVETKGPLISRQHFLILNKTSLKFVCWGLIDNKSALVQVMAWHQMNK